MDPKVCAHPATAKKINSMYVCLSICLFVKNVHLSNSLNLQISRSLFKTLEDATLQQKFVTSLVTASEKSKSAEVVNKVNHILRQVLHLYILLCFSQSVNITYNITVKFDNIKPFGDWDPRFGILVRRPSFYQLRQFWNILG